MRPLILSVLLATASSASATEDAFGDRVRAYLLENPEVILEAMEILAAREAKAEAAARIATHAEVLFDTSRAQFLGDPEAPHLIVELFDYKCHSCKAGHPVLEAFVAAHPDVAIAVQQLPILGPQSDRAARAVLALHEVAGVAASAALHEELFAFSGAISSAVLERMLEAQGADPAQVEEVMYGPDVSTRIDAMKDAALDLGAIGTPVFVTARGLHQGVATPEVLEELLADLTAE